VTKREKGGDAYRNLRPDAIASSSEWLTLSLKPEIGERVLRRDR
jgi:hypothetical protein